MASSNSWKMGELLCNGNFEQGLSLWRIHSRGQAGVKSGTFRTINGGSENKVAEFKVNGPGVVRIYQETVEVHPGKCYELSFFIRNAVKTLTPGIFGAEVFFVDESGELLDRQSYGISNPSHLMVWTYHFMMTNEAPTNTKRIRVELYAKVKDPGNTLHLMVDDVDLRAL